MKRIFLLLVCVFSFLLVGCEKDTELTLERPTEKEIIYTPAPVKEKYYNFVARNNSLRSDYRFRIYASDNSTILHENVIRNGEYVRYTLKKGRILHG